MAGSAQSAVDTLLGRLTSALLDEAQLLSGVRGEVQFIKREMESMSGFLLDVSDAGRQPSNQVRAWTKQVQELAYDSQNCVDRYVQTFGGAPVGVLGSIWRAPRLLCTRYRIATQIRELKARALEVGERRQRYGVTAPEKPPPAVADRGDVAGKEADDARRRRALAEACAFLDLDARAGEVVEWWLMGEQWAEREFERYPEIMSAAKAYMVSELNADTKSGLEMARWSIGLVDGRDPETEGEATNMPAPAHQSNETMDKQIENKEVPKKKKKSAGLWEKYVEKPLEKKMNQLLEKAIRELYPDSPMLTQEPAGSGSKNQNLEQLGAWNKVQWMKQVFGVDHPQGRGLRVLFVLSPFAMEGLEEAGLEEADNGEPRRSPATDLARKAYTHPRAAEHFDCRVWVDARICSQRKERLQSILRALQLSCPGGDDDDEEAELEFKIRQQLRCKRFLIVLDDPNDESAWAHISPALPAHDDFSAGSAVMVTTSMNYQQGRIYGWLAERWLTAGWLFSLFGGAHPYKVHCCFVDPEVALKAAAELWNEDVSGTVREIILKKCRSDPFATKMVLAALYANPQRSKGEWDKLLPSLNDFFTVSNARQMIRFCYDDLPSSYKSCLLYLSIFPPDTIIRRTSLVRRWAAEGLVTKRDGHSATDEAGHCFGALIDRGLVLPRDIGPAGKVKSCRVHPHVSSFIARMPRDNDDAAANTTDLPPDLAHRLSIRSGIQLQQLTKKKQQATGLTGCSCWKTIKSSTTTAQSKNSKLDMVTLLSSLPSTQFGLIKVLDLEDCPGLNKQHVKNICNKIFQLKYLSLRNTDVDKLPKEIDKLHDLETFDIRGTKIQAFPAKVINLPKLACLLAGRIGPQGKDALGSGHESFSTLHIPLAIGSMANMQILSHVEACESADEDVLNDVGRLQQLRKLGVVIHGRQALLNRLLRVIGMLNEVLCSLSICIRGGDGVADMNPRSVTFSAPRFLSNLNISGKISGLPTWIKELEQLSKITLSRTSLADIDIRILGNLVNLRFIRLGHKSYTQKNLNFRNGFKKLEVLVLESSDISDIHFEQKAAPVLEKIVWTSTCKVETLGIEKLPSIKEIELNGDCELSHIKNSVDANPNRPKLKYRSTT